MASRRRSLLSFLFLSIILFSLSKAHPNHPPSNDRRQSLDLSIEKWEDTTETLSSTITTDILDDDVVQLPKSLKDFLHLLGLGLKLFGDALASLVRDRVAAGNVASGSSTTSTILALMTNFPDLGRLVPPISTHSWSNASSVARTSSTVVRLNSTSFITVTSTRLRTVTATRSRPAALAISTASSRPAILPLTVTQSALPFGKRNIVQVYAGRYPGIARTISDLNALCTDPDIDIITLAGITTYFSDQTPQPIPVADFDALCNDTLAISLSGESECNALSGALREYQTLQNKNLFLAVETGTENTTLHSAREARTLARNLWDIFGAGKATESGARKYTIAPPRNSLGIAFDGFEFLVNTTTIDDKYFATTSKARHKKRESEIFVPPTLPYFDVLFEELRTLTLTDGDTSKPYYLSVSLPCTRPSILSKTSLQLVDFVSVRFMNDVACNIDGPAFSNFLTIWGKDVADHWSADRIGGGGGAAAAPALVSALAPSFSHGHSSTHMSVLADVEAESTTTITTTRIRTTTIPRPKDTSTSNLMNSTSNSPLLSSLAEVETRAPDLNPQTTPQKHRRQRPQQSANSPPFFILGIPVPSQELQDATSLAGTGSADPTTLSNILNHARDMFPGFVGVLLWGGMEDMEVGQQERAGYLGFVKDLLDRGPVGAGLAAGTVVGNSEVLDVGLGGLASITAPATVDAFAAVTRSLVTSPAVPSYSAPAGSVFGAEVVVTVRSTRILTRTIMRSTRVQTAVADETDVVPVSMSEAPTATM